jgi:hypothetical protein
MRILAYILFSMFSMFSLSIGAGPASAWTEYVYLDQGVAIQFPVKPQTMQSTYDSAYAKGLAATVHSAEDDHVQYRLTVVNVTRPAEMGVNFLNEAAYWLMRKGDVLYTDFPRVYQDPNGVYGVTLVVDRPDRTRVRTSLFFNRGKLYVIDTILLPTRSDKDMSIPSRFDQTIRFPPDGRFD